MARCFVLMISIAWYASMQSFTTEELNAGFMSTALRTNYFHYFSGTNKLEKISPTAGGNVTAPFTTNNRSFTYDKNGNVMTDNLRDQTMSYDRANLPYKSVKANGSTQSYGYNTADARIFKGNDALAHYYLAGSVYDMKNDEWEHYPGGLAVHKNNSLNLIIKDHLTNTRAIVMDGTDKCAGSMGYQAQYDYYPYGKVLRKTENPRSRFQSTDHETDEETGYNNRNARWYDDESFSFLQIDPMQTTYPSWSPYHYVARNPISLLDPTGMNWYQSTSGDNNQYIWYDGDGEREGYKNLGSSSTIEGKRGDYKMYSILLNPDGTAEYSFPFQASDKIGPGTSGETPAGSYIIAREKTPDELTNESSKACSDEWWANRPASGAAQEMPTFFFDLILVGKSAYNLGSAIYSMNAAKGGGTFYRAMGNAEFAALESSGGLSHMAGKELFVSSSANYSRAYLQKSGYDVLVQFNMKPDVMNYFNQVGVMHRTAAGASGWAGRGSLLWKSEQGVMNLGIQSNTHMFNPWINSFKVIR